jgi:hypothetical protein
MSFHSDIIRPDDERRLGIASHRLSSLLHEQAERERNLNPEEPRIHCAIDSCGRWAVEGWYFCSEECRNEAVRSMVPP